MNIQLTASAQSPATPSPIDLIRGVTRATRAASVVALLLGYLITTGCNSGGDGGTAGGPPVLGTSCSFTQLESDMNSILSGVSTDVDFSFAVDRQDGRRYTYNRGTSTLQTSYESASTSKLVSAAIILRQVEKGYLNLTDKPQDRIPGWPISNSDPLYNLTLAQLLSFTSGLTDEPACLNLPGAHFETCVNTIATLNAGNGNIPGAAFHYGSAHLQVAGLMAVKAYATATSNPTATWQDLFTEAKTMSGLFPTSTYDLPSASNPRLAGGMHWTGEEYLAFLSALKDGTLLNASSMNQMLADHTASAMIIYSPIALTPPNGLGENWHYGLGHWIECESPASSPFTCSASTSRVSSPGAYGAYPFWDRTHNYTGIVARQGTIGTFPNGIAIERAVRTKVEEWGSCS